MTRVKTTGTRQMVCLDPEDRARVVALAEKHKMKAAEIIRRLIRCGAKRAEEDPVVLVEVE